MVREYLGAAIACALLAGPIGAAAKTAGTDCKIEQVAQFKVRPGVGKPIVDGEINGHPIKIVIFTGSNVTAIWRETAVRLGLPLRSTQDAVVAGATGPESKVQLAQVKDLKVDGVSLGAKTILVIGLKPHTNE